MTAKTLKDVRKTFKDFFKKNGHQVVDSSPLVPQNDPTLMFANSGMVQFKNVFTGLEQRNYKRATTSQKCVRAGGKHNDLENVGFTPRHHTFFEMLGNFSFGDYFKEEAIQYAWQLITKEYSLPKDKLYVTVFSKDQEAYDLWHKITGFNEDRIIKISTSDNFWSMGDTGPCGPCSEIFYDHGDHLFGGLPGTKDQDGDRFIEIWNLVFMQFEQISKDKKINLPKPSVDTGMGLERMAAVLQGTHDNYQIDLFKKIILDSESFFDQKISKKNTASYRVIADHLRASAFLISDGVLPSNEGRGYVLRRIMRRAMRHSNVLGKTDPILYKVVPTIIELMKEEYPQLENARDLIKETIITEEERFSLLLKNGLKILNDEVFKIKKKILPGSVAFKLYDTYGFPVDLTQDVLKEKNISIDHDEFKKLREQSKVEARASWKGTGSTGIDKIWFEIVAGQNKKKLIDTEFFGYASDQIESRLLSIVKENKTPLEIKEGESASLIFNQTVFYAESGGQISDTGIIESNGVLFEVKDTQKIFRTFYVHSGVVKKGVLKVGDDFVLKINKKRRDKIKCNHSATHLLHAALREKLGKHVSQKGSYVGPDRLRFDFSHSRPISGQEILELNKNINTVVRNGGEVKTTIMSPKKAIEQGAMALFGEKYGDEVRVVTMGSINNKTFSTELCGGTHVDNLSAIGNFEIINETSIASGVRRIEALRGDELSIHKQSLNNLAKEKEVNLNSHIQDLESKIKKLNGSLEDFKDFVPEEKIAKLKIFYQSLYKKNILQDFKKNIIKDYPLKDITLRIQYIYGLSGKDLRTIVDDNKKEIGKSAVFTFSELDNKLNISVGITDGLTNNLDASFFAKEISKFLNGKGGGGRKDFAQAGGEPPSSLNSIYDFVLALVEKKIN
jgi:alanyl-tRNA synthetase